MIKNDLKIIRKESVDSTNTFAMNLLKIQGDGSPFVVWADEQLSGKGQQGNKWFSTRGESLTFSLGFNPEYLPAHQQFFLSMAVSLGIIDFFKPMQLDVKIKWPNDIYHNDRKLGGILIENVISRDVINGTVIGVGLNVNQSEFPAWLPNPVSLKEITGNEFDIDRVFDDLVDKIISRLHSLVPNEFSKLKKEYLTNLLGYMQFRHYVSNGEKIMAKIIEIDDEGPVHMLTDKDEKHVFRFREVELVT